jgi:hypothetical protein
LKRRYIPAAAAIAALALAVWYFQFRPHARSAAPAERPPAPGAVTGPGGPPAAPARASVASADPYATDAPSHLADKLNDPSGDIHADLRILDDIFQQYRSALHSSNPVGENVEITAALTGHNKVGFAFIPPDNPAVNSRGELCDRWGTPFFFHQVSGTQMEIRSAGPDRRLWTADDEVLTPGIRQPRL